MPAKACKDRVGQHCEAQATDPKHHNNMILQADLTLKKRWQQKPVAWMCSCVVACHGFAPIVCHALLLPACPNLSLCGRLPQAFAIRRLLRPFKGIFGFRLQFMIAAQEHQVCQRKTLQLTVTDPLQRNNMTKCDIV